MKTEVIDRVLSVLQILTDKRVLDTLTGRGSPTERTHWVFFGTGLALGAGAMLLLAPEAGHDARKHALGWVTAMRSKLDGDEQGSHARSNGHVEGEGAHRKHAAAHRRARA